MNQTLKQLIGLIPALCFLVACQEDTFPDGSRPSDGVLRLSGMNAQQIQIDTRADGVKGFFKENTHYRILMEGDADGDGSQQPKLRFSDVGRDMVAGSQHFIQLLEKQGNLVFKNEKDVVNFYGLTDPAIQKEDDNSEKYKEFVTGYLPVENFQYELTASKEKGKYTLPDLRSAVSIGNSLEQLSYVIPLHFKHILSKVNFEIVQQVAEGSEGGLFGDLALEGISVPGQPTVGNFHLKENRFIKLTEAKDYPVSLKEDATSIPITITPQEVGSILLFPMTAETLGETNMLKVEVTLGGEVETLKKFGQGVKDDDGDGKGSLTLTCPVYANNPAGGGDGTTPLRLLPNYEYDLQFVIMSNEVRIITIVPRVYEWLDGEKDNWNEEDGHYEEQDLGQPITFNGVVWSDRNLGASSAHPLRSVEDWMKSVGYYYQYDRNIPYFPNSLKEVTKEGKTWQEVNLNTSLEEALQWDRLLYPVVNYVAWGMDAYPSIEQLKPKDIVDSEAVSEIGILPSDGTKPLFNYDTQTANFQTDLWKTPETQPCPKGWRIPTKEDIYSVIPGSVYSGNLTFRVVGKYNSNAGNWDVSENTGANESQEAMSEYDFAQQFSKEKIEAMVFQKGGADIEPMTNEDGKQVCYLGSFPCLYREEKNDPQQGATSCYVLSMSGDDWSRAMDATGTFPSERRGEDYVFNYGVIYGLKNKGTDKAYRVKWELKLVGHFNEVDIPETAKKYCWNNPNTTQYEGKKAKQYTEGLKGMLVISRFTATPADNFDPVDGSYEWVAKAKDWWSNPVEVMYLPICGVAGHWARKGGGGPGSIYNIGTEGWYATTEENQNDKKQKGILWIKVMGDNSKNQFIIYSDKSPKDDVVNIRPVRDN